MIVFNILSRDNLSLCVQYNGTLATEMYVTTLTISFKYMKSSRWWSGDTRLNLVSIRHINLLRGITPFVHRHFFPWGMATRSISKIDTWHWFHFKQLPVILWHPMKPCMAPQPVILRDPRVTEMCLRTTSLSIRYHTISFAELCKSALHSKRMIWLCVLAPQILCPGHRTCVCIGQSLPRHPITNPTSHVFFGKDAEWLMHKMAGLEVPGTLVRFFLSKSYFFSI